MGDDQAAEASQQGDRKNQRRGAWLLVPTAVVAILVLLLLLATCNAGRDGEVARQAASTTEVGVKVPDLTGASVAFATPLLNTLDLHLSVETSTQADPEEQTIVLQHPKKGSIVSPGTTVTVTVVASEPVAPEPYVPAASADYGTSGPAQVGGTGKVRVPDVIGLSPSAAARRARGAGLEPTPLRRPVLSGERRQNVVVGQFPRPGTVVPAGTELTYRYYQR